MWFQLYIYDSNFISFIFNTFYKNFSAKLNQSPMVFIEGESELVPGFNIEYFKRRFTLIFLAKYGIMIFFRFIRILLFTSLLIYPYFFIFYLLI